MKANKVCISEKERNDIKDIVVRTIERKSSVTKEEIAAAIEDFNKKEQIECDAAGLEHIKDMMCGA